MTAISPEGARLIRPRVAGRAPLHASVPESIRSDYKESALVLADSPKASAALSRRCLQALLVLQGAKQTDLIKQIDELAPSLPSYLSEHVDHIRKLGNISAHTRVSKSTGEIVDVEPGEAEWMLAILDMLLDHYYTRPARAREMKTNLDAKFADAGPHKPKPK